MKSQDTPAAAEALRGVVRPDALVVSLQNGLRNVAALRTLPAEVVPGVVAFNVVWDGGDLVHATSGAILVGPSERSVLSRFLEALRRACSPAFSCCPT